MEFKNKTEIYEFVKANPMAYHRMLKSTNKELFIEIKQKYTGTKSIGENFWLYCHDYATPLTCICGTKLLFENVIKGYKSKECMACYSVNRVINGIIETKKREQLTQSTPTCANTICNNDVTLTKDGTWSQYCSLACRGQYNSKKSRAKSKQTMLKNHGVEHALQNTVIFEQMQQNNIKKHGHSNVMHSGNIVNTPVNTKIALYGAPSSWSGSIQYQHHVDVAGLKYGYLPGSFTNVSQIPEVHTKKMKSAFLARDYTLPSGNTIRIQGYEDRFLNKTLAYYDESSFNFNIIGVKYNFENKIHTYYPDFWFNDYVIEVKSDYTFYDDFDKNMAKAYGVFLIGNKFVFNIECNDTSNYICIDENKCRLVEFLDEATIEYTEYKQFGNYIVDMHFPEAGIVLCVRNSTFTDEVFVAPDYYTKMHNYFENQGIQLITVFTDKINDIWLTSFMSKLQLNDDRVFARNTECRLVKTGIFDFLNKNHIQGFTSTSIVYGLYNKEELVAVMCFNKFRHGIGKDRGVNSYELVRYATSKHVIGGASKLLKHFIKEHNPELIYSYSDNAISTGNMYKVLGFTLENSLDADYKYINPNDGNMHHRFKYRKGALVDMPIYDATLSERSIMKLNGYRRIYDSGKKTWVLDLT